MRKTISSGAPWEDRVGYSRAVRIGNYIEVSGTTATDDGGVAFVGDPYRQARLIFQKIESALQEAGAAMSDVIRTRVYVVDISHWEEIGKAHAEFFGAIKPAATMVEVSKLIDRDMLVEIEATAVVEE